MSKAEGVFTQDSVAKKVAVAFLHKDRGTARVGTPGPNHSAFRLLHNIVSRDVFRRISSALNMPMSQIGVRKANLGVGFWGLTCGNRGRASGRHAGEPQEIDLGSFR